MGISLYDYCKERGDDALLSQWDEEKNANLSPKQLSFGSWTKAWWTCSNGHSWEAAVKSRTRGCGCPYCAGRSVWPGYNDLATRYPAIAEEWHPTKNGDLTPADVVVGSKQRVWWLCEKGHEWCTLVSTRTSGSGCPVCAGKRVIPGDNDLASHFPLIAAQWDKERNGNLTPEMVTPFSNRMVWWICDAGHSFYAAVGHRTNAGSDCPYCSGRRVLAGFNDLATREPEVAAQWNPTRNGDLTPEMVTSGSSKKVWWICPEGHEWPAVISSRTGKQRCGCPQCAGRGRKARNTKRYDEILRDGILADTV